jgi:hypothetical protein
MFPKNFSESMKIDNFNVIPTMFGVIDQPLELRGKTACQSGYRSSVAD